MIALKESDSHEIAHLHNWLWEYIGFWGIIF